MQSILIIEDDIALSNGIVLALQKEGLKFAQCYNLKDAREMSEQQKFDVVILDVNLPDGNGLSFLKAYKQKHDTPVIVLTANDLEIDIVTGLEMGADDYITKPFSLMVLRARVNTQLRKMHNTNRNRFEIDCFIFDFEKMEFLKNGDMIELSKTEQKLLKRLILNQGITMQRASLVDYLWTEDAEYVDENALSVTVKRLRDKLEDNPSAPNYIKTVYGIGYVWAASKE